MSPKKSITLDNLQIGMTINEKIVDNYTNETIIEEGTILDEQGVNKLRTFLLQMETMKKLEEDSFSNLAKDYHSKAINNQEQLEFIAHLSEEEQNNFIEFKKEYDLAEEKTLDYMKILNRNEAVHLDDVFEITSNIVDGFKPRSNVFTFLNYLKGHKEYAQAHSINVALLGNVFARWLNLNKEETKILAVSGLLIDIGKSKISPDILNKTDKLTTEEFKEIENHTRLGYGILRDQPFLPQDIKLAVLQHHERIDGSGYTQKLKGDTINKFAKMIAICDVYEAMISERPYRKRICPFEVIKEFETSYFSKMDTAYLMIFLKNIAYNYLGRKVCLSDGRTGEVVFINANVYSSPLVMMEDGTYEDLVMNRKLSITAVL